MTPQLWTCRRIVAGVRCGYRNESRHKKCRRCGQKRLPRRTPLHMRGLAGTYEEYVALNGGEFCGICGRPPTSSRRLDRDHSHRTGEARGLLCHRCNRTLAAWMTIDWLRNALVYLSRTEVPQNARRSDDPE